MACAGRHLIQRRLSGHIANEHDPELEAGSPKRSCSTKAGEGAMQGCLIKHRGV